MQYRFDLHLHTTASDGLLSPEQLVDLSLERGLEIIAITDHDSTDGIDCALVRAQGTPLQVWAGVEISADIPRTEIHVLGYFINHHDPAFESALATLRQGRMGRARQMVQKLGQLGVRIDWGRVQELAGDGAVGRPHVAQALVEAGYVSDPREAFALFIGRSGPAYVEREKLTPPEAVKLVCSAGGLASLAHPIYIESPEESGKQTALRRLLPELLDAGLAGIEAFYPDHSRSVTRDLVGIAHEFGLIPTGGTDFHGRGSHHIDIGEIDVPEETITLMQAWRDRRDAAD